MNNMNLFNVTQKEPLLTKGFYKSHTYNGTETMRELVDQRKIFHIIKKVAKQDHTTVLGVIASNNGRAHFISKEDFNKYYFDNAKVNKLGHLYFEHSAVSTIGRPITLKDYQKINLSDNIRDILHTLNCMH